MSSFREGKARISFHAHFFVDIFICAVEKTKTNKKTNMPSVHFPMLTEWLFFSVANTPSRQGVAFGLQRLPPFLFETNYVSFAMPLVKEVAILRSLLSPSFLTGTGMPFFQATGRQLGPSLWCRLLQTYKQCKPFRTGRNECELKSCKLI